MKKKNDIKQPSKGGRRKDGRGKFVIPTPQEQANDRAHYLDSVIQQTVVDGDKMLQMMLNINYRAILIEFRRTQLGLDKDYNDSGKIVITEQFNSTLKPADLLRSELDLDLFVYKTQIREFENLKDKFVKQYKFSSADINSILKGYFNWSDWANTKSQLDIKPKKGKK